MVIFGRSEIVADEGHKVVCEAFISDLELQVIFLFGTRNAARRQKRPSNKGGHTAVAVDISAVYAKKRVFLEWKKNSDIPPQSSFSILPE